MGSNPAITAEVWAASDTALAGYENCVETVELCTVDASPAAGLGLKT